MGIFGKLKGGISKAGKAISSIPKPIAWLNPMTGITQEFADRGAFEKAQKAADAAKNMSTRNKAMAGILLPSAIPALAGAEIFGRKKEAGLSLPNDPDKIDYTELEEARRKRLENLSAQEVEQYKQLGQRTSATQQAIDEELRVLTSDLGYNSDRLRGDVAGMSADRGMLRSTFANEQIGEVNKQQLQEQASLETQARGRKQATTQAAVDAVNEIQKQRQSLADQLREADLEHIQNINEQFSMQSIRNKFESQLADMEIDAADKAMLLGALGSIGGSFAGIAASKGSA